ncbi:MAG: DUF1697 domain-containing protein [Thermoleophilia bacterium]
MSRQVALLRGINVGTARPVGMAALREVVEGLGATDVATHLRSGNVVYEAGETPARMATRLAAAIEEEFGFPVPVVVRSARQMAKVVADNPLADEAARDPRRLQVIFLSAKPKGGDVAGLEDEDVGDDRIRLAGTEIYVWSPGGITGSPGLAALEKRRLPLVATARNWRTVERLAAMAAG